MTRWKMFIEINQLKEAGFSRIKVAEQLRLNRKTVAKYWDMEPHEFSRALNQAGNRKRKLDKYEKTIVEWLKKFPDMTAAQVEDWLRDALTIIRLRNAQYVPTLLILGTSMEFQSKQKTIANTKR